VSESNLAAILRNLVQQIEMGTYRDELGHKLTMNVAFIAARKASDAVKATGKSTAPPE
jgi:hypothetical protein